tara:strand:- start:254 stop:496 length:243 start_codon:yes stop_codon:yes gene_type:complete
MKSLTYILFFTFIYGCAEQEANTIKYKFRTEEVVKKDCRIAIEQKNSSVRNDVNSKNFIKNYTKAFNANNKIKRACDPYR